MTLTAEDAEVSTVYSGTGRLVEPDAEPLSAIIERLNARYGAEWQDTDRLVRDAVDRIVAREDVQLAAANNTPENFAVVFPEYLQDEMFGQLERAEKAVLGYFENEPLRRDLQKMYVTLVQARASVAYQEHCPVTELLATGEGPHLEYKSTLRTHADSGELFKPLESATVTTVAAFANSRQGGTLLIGAADDGIVHGLASDYASLHKDGKDDRDLFLLHLAQVLVNGVGATVASLASAQIHTVDGRDLCRIHVPPSSFPVEATVTVEKGGRLEKKTTFYVRIGNGTHEITDPAERRRYIATRWGAFPSRSGGDQNG